MSVMSVLKLNQRLVYDIAGRSFQDFLSGTIHEQDVPLFLGHVENVRNEVEQVSNEMSILILLDAHR